MIEYLIKLLQKKHKVGTISRGYGRKTKGIILAGEEDNAETIGDEPLQFYRKFSPKVHVMVGEHRSVAIPKLLSLKPETQVVLLDDAFQHRWVLPHLNIMLTDYNRLFFKDFILPVGRLRESRSGVNRADVIIITKCPDELGYMKEYIKIKLSKYVTKEKVPLFFTGLKYGTPIPVYNKELEFDIQADLMLFCGIADPKPLISYLENKYSLKNTEIFSDHFSYQPKDIDHIIAKFEATNSKHKCLITTEKDMVKLLNEDLKAKLIDYPVFYISIEVNFLENESAFQKIVLKGLK